MQPTCTSFPLPLECLQLIIRHLASQSDNNNLTSLLRVNKYTCSATLPIVYENPLHFCRFRDSPNGLIRSNDDILADLLHLIRVLLSSVPQDRVTSLLKAAYLNHQAAADDPKSKDQQHQLSLGKSAIPYYTFLTKVDFQYHSRRLNQRIFHNETLINNKGFNDELDCGGHAKRYLIEDVGKRLTHRQDSISIARGAARDLRKDLTWALCANAEKIKDLVIPISDITRYLGQTYRFKVLSDVTFLLDRDTNHTIPSGRELSTQEQEEKNAQRTERTRHLEEMVSFVQEHQRLHPGVLTFARCSSDHTVEEVCPADYQFQLSRVLSPLYKPVAIDNSNWVHFVAYAQETDLSFVKRIWPPSMAGSLGASWNQLAAGTPFLHRCRALESVGMTSLGDDAFQWAVNERKEQNADIASGRTPRQLVPLRNFTVEYKHFSNGRQVNDVLFAFSQSLEVISIAYMWPGEQSEFSIGNNIFNNLHYDFPALSTITAYTFDVLLRLHPDFLCRCPKLTTIELEDWCEDYSLYDVVHWKAANLPLLHRLHLKGTPAISFHPDTLRTTPRLVILELEIEIEESLSFIPPPQEFAEIESEQQQQQMEEDEDTEVRDGELSNNNHMSIRRPIWTWDWDLPCLTNLSLTSEFAYRFQFRMLDGTPNLVSLNVDIGSTTGQHRRAIDVTDFVKPGYQHRDLAAFMNKELQDDDDRDDDKVWLDFEYVNVPRLTECYICGQWIFKGSRALQVLFGKVAPGIAVLIMVDTTGYDLIDVVDSTSENLPDLRRATVTCHAPEAAALEAGLVVESKLNIHAPSYLLVRQPAKWTYEKPPRYTFFEVHN
jgi:hypothetical protein